MADTANEGQKLTPGESLTSVNGAYTLTLQEDGNLVLYAANGAAWSTHTESDAPPPPLVEPEEAAPEGLQEEAGSRTYTVVSGDTLWAIAEQLLGDGNKYQEIATASGIANPDHIEPGQILTIP